VTLASGALVELEIEKAVYRGRGLGRHEGRVVFVAGALPGDVALVRVTRVTRDYAEAVVASLKRPAPGRRGSPCPFFPRCGGCSYQELDYARQLELKRAVLAETLQRGGVELASAAAATEVVPSPEVGWRIRAAVHATWRDEGLMLGFHEAATRRVVDIDGCLQLGEGLNAALRALRAALASRPRLARPLRGIDLAEPIEGGSAVMSVEGAYERGAVVEFGALAVRLEGVAGLRLRGRGFEQHVFGAASVTTRVLGHALRFDPEVFFQANRFLVEPLVDEVCALVPSGGTVLDLYAGVGLFTLRMAERHERVLAVEHDPRAVRDARANLAAAGSGNVELVVADVGEALAATPATPGERVVLDPPRSGAGVAVAEAIAARRPETIVYVSCDPPTLARDLAAFARAGYFADHLKAFDLFPDTFHLETVVRLRPR
jgi:23S rRNA (uracil1939-C5)-methyltransferase